MVAAGSAQYILGLGQQGHVGAIGQGGLAQLRTLKVSRGAFLAHRNDVVPLAIEHGIIALGNGFQAVEALGRQLGPCIGGCPLLQGIPTVALAVEDGTVHQLATLNLVVHILIVTGALIGRQLGEQALGLSTDTGVLGDTALGLAIVGKRELGINIDLATVSVVRPLRAKAHTLGFTLESEVIERAEDIGNVAPVLTAEHIACPLSTVVDSTLIVEHVNVVGEVEEVVNSKLAELDVAGVEQPDAVGCRVVSLAQLLVHQGWRGGIHPQVVMRPAQVRRVIIHTRATRSLLLGGVAQTLEVAVVVVGPDEGNVIGQLKSVVVHIEHLLVRSKGLGNVLGGFLQYIGQYLALSLDSLGHHVLALAQVVASSHGHVVQAA